MKKANSSIPMSKRKKKRTALYYVGKVAAYAVLILFAAIILLPFLIAIITSFTPELNLLENGFQWFTGVLDTGYYHTLLATDEYGNIFRALGNTLLYIAPPVLLGTFCSAMAAYALARIKFRGRTVIFFVMLATMVIPGIIITFPSFLLFKQVYKVDDWFPMMPIIIPGIFGGVGTMFFLRQYFLTLPKELEEAAEMDGMSRFGMFIKIILPLSLPAIVTQLLLGFNGAYNDYLVPLIYTAGKTEYYTIQLFVYGLSTSRNSSYPLLMAGGMLALIPTLILYICGQKFFVEGIVMTGIKS